MTTRRPDQDNRSSWDLSESLRSLPRQTADQGFTAQVLARLDDEPQPRESRSRTSGWRGGSLGGWLLAGAATAALAWAVGAALLGPDRLVESPRVAETTTPGISMPEATVPGSAAPRPAADDSAAARPESVPAGSPPADPVGAAQPDRRTASALETRGTPAPAPAPTPVAVDPPVRPAATELSHASRRRAELAEVRSALEALRREHRRLAADLVDLPEIGADGQPVLYVGGDEGLGLVLGPSRGAGSVRPAAYPGGGASL